MSGCLESRVWLGSQAKGQESMEWVGGSLMLKSLHEQGLQTPRIQRQPSSVRREVKDPLVV